MTSLDPDLIRAFVTVVDAGGFTQAAERLRRGQSAVSLQVKRLEDRLGTRLLDRSPRHVRLTPDGERLIHQARALLSLNDELLASVDAPMLAGVVRLGAPEDFATSHLPALLARYARSHPNVALEVTCELTLQLLDRFRSGELDLVLVKREASHSDGGRGVWREPLVWVGANADVARRAGPLPLVVSPRPCVYRKRATEALDTAERAWRIVYTCGSLAGSLAAVRAGLGVTVLPKEMVPTDLTLLSEDTLALPDLKDTEMALMEAANLSPAALRLRDDLLRELEHGPSRV
jgi:DNA-binding transcriptional LysR family regulator